MGAGGYRRFYNPMKVDEEHWESILENSMRITRLSYELGLTDIPHDMLLVDTFTDEDGYNNTIDTSLTTAGYNADKKAYVGGKLKIVGDPVFVTSLVQNGKSYASYDPFRGIWYRLYLGTDPDTGYEALYMEIFDGTSTNTIMVTTNYDSIYGFAYPRPVFSYYIPIAISGLYYGGGYRAEYSLYDINGNLIYNYWLEKNWDAYNELKHVYIHSAGSYALARILVEDDTYNRYGYVYISNKVIVSLRDVPSDYWKDRAIAGMTANIIYIDSKVGRNFTVAGTAYDDYLGYTGYSDYIGSVVDMRSINQLTLGTDTAKNAIRRVYFDTNFNYVLKYTSSTASWTKKYIFYFLSTNYTTSSSSTYDPSYSYANFGTTGAETLSYFPVFRMAITKGWCIIENKAWNTSNPWNPPIYTNVEWEVDGILSSDGYFYYQPSGTSDIYRYENIRVETEPLDLYTKLFTFNEPVDMIYVSLEAENQEGIVVDILDENNNPIVSNAPLMDYIDVGGIDKFKLRFRMYPDPDTYLPPTMYSYGVAVMFR